MMESVYTTRGNWRQAVADVNRAERVSVMTPWGRIDVTKAAMRKLLRSFVGSKDVLSWSWDVETRTMLILGRRFVNEVTGDTYDTAESVVRVAGE